MHKHATGREADLMPAAPQVGPRIKGLGQAGYHAAGGGTGGAGQQLGVELYCLPALPLPSCCGDLAEQH